MNENPTGSALERAIQCAASCALPRVQRTTAESIKGNDNHGGIEDGLVVGGDLSKLPKVVQWAMDNAAAVDVEVAFAIDTQTEFARVLGSRLGRNYGKLADSELALTVDAIITKADGTVWVWDWKSRERVTPAAKNIQLRAGCVAVMKTRGKTVVGGAIGYLDDSESDTTQVDTFDAAALLADLRSMQNRIGAVRALVATGGVPDVHSGPWCKYCPSIPYCPAQNRLAMQMLGELDYVQKQIEFFTPDQVSKAWDLSKQIGKLLDTVDASLRLRIQQGYIPRPNNKRLAMVEMPGRKSFDADKAIERIKQLGGQVDDLWKTGKPFEQVKEIKA